MSPSTFEIRLVCCDRCCSVRAEIFLDISTGSSSSRSSMNREGLRMITSSEDSESSMNSTHVSSIARSMYLLRSSIDALPLRIISRMVGKTLYSSTMPSIK